MNHHHIMGEYLSPRDNNVFYVSKKTKEQKRRALKGVRSLV